MIHCDADRQNGHDTRTASSQRASQSLNDSHDANTDPWNGPFSEYNKYGRPTGHAYVRCADCGIEVVTSQREHATHRAGCQYADDGEQ